MILSHFLVGGQLEDGFKDFYNHHSINENVRKFLDFVSLVGILVFGYFPLFLCQLSRKNYQNFLSCFNLYLENLNGYSKDLFTILFSGLVVFSRKSTTSGFFFFNVRGINLSDIFAGDFRYREGLWCLHMFFFFTLCSVSFSNHCIGKCLN